MKKSLLIIGLVLFTFLVNAQITQFSEDFETTPLNVTSSGSATWDRSSSLYSSGMYSDSANIVNSNDTAILTTNAIDISGYSNVKLSFEQICKIEFFDSAYIEVSTDNGTTWNRLVDSNYLGAGQFGSIGDRFNSTSYALDWVATDYNAIPTNSWWKTEVFDVSAFAGSYTQFKVRFVLKDGNGTGSLGNYGWLIDDVEVMVSNGELNPPTVLWVQPILEGTIYGNGPFEVNANIFDETGVDTAMIEYTIGSVVDTVGMSLVGSNLYRGLIPSQQYNTSVSYKIIAIDESSNSNVTNTNLKTFVNQEQDVVASIGSGTSSSYRSPFYNGSITDVKNRSSHISIISAADLVGYFGKVSKLGFEKYDNTGYTSNDAEVKIYLKHTNLSTLPTDSSGFYGEFTGSTLVYNSTTESIPALTGMLEYTLNQGNFVYDGSSSIMVMVEWYRPSALVQNYVKFKYTYLSGKAYTFYGDEYRSADSYYNGHYPNMQLTFSRVPVNNDVQLFSITDPNPVILVGSNPVNIRIRNSGDLALTKATIDWEIDSISQPTYVWNGNMQYGLITNDLNIGSYNFPQGPHSIKVWAHSPNDLVDQNPLNDTMTMDFYACTSILNGYYTVGGSGADFIDIEAAMEAIMHCGMNGPTTIALNDGNYAYNFYLDNTIPGLDSINTLTFTSVSQNSSNVVIEAANENAEVITLDRVEHISFSHITIKSEKTGSGNVVYITNSSSYITFDNCKFDLVTNFDSQNRCIYIYDGIFNNISITNNEFIGGSYVIYATNNSINSSDNFLVISNNDIKEFGIRGVYASRFINSEISHNYVRNQYDITNTATKYGIYVYYGDFCKVFGNDILIHNDGAVYGLYLYYSSGSNAGPALAYNNISVIKGNTSSSSFRSLYINNCSYLDVVNNTFVTYAGSSTSETVYVSNNNKTNLQLINNVIANMAGGYAIETYNTLTTLSNIDYNSYYSTGGIIVKFDGTTTGSSLGISGIKNLTTFDTNSMVSDPMVYSIDNARSFSTFLSNAATPYSYITNDIDGNVRSTTNPSVGAFEFTVATTDAGLLEIINPIAIDTQSRVTDMQLIVRNFGTDPITSMNIKYVLDNNTPVSYAYTGNIPFAGFDTVSIPNFTVPALDFKIKAYTELSGDTNTFNDSIQTSFYGLPLIEAEIGSLQSPIDGCEKTGSEIVSIEITNNGINDINNGLTASYKVDGSASFIIENVTDTILAGQTITFEFAQTTDMTPGLVDTVYNFIFAVSHNDDLLNFNDSSSATANSLAPLQDPAISDTTINYGSSITLNAVHTETINWFENDTTTTILNTGTSYITPLLFDTTTYWLQASANIPPSNAHLGSGNNMYGNWDVTIYGGNGSLGKHQLLYTAAELTAAGLNAGQIESISFETFSTFGTISDFEIKMANSGVSTLVSTFEPASFTSVFHGAITSNGTWMVHSFTSPFFWDGTSNIVVEICAMGIGFFAAPMYYTPTSFQSVNSVAGMGTSCATASGITSNKRPNTKFVTYSALGCSSAKTSATVNVPLPQFDAAVDQIVSPITSCGIGQAEVSINIINQGTDTLVSGYTTTYKINGGTYITPETISADIAPGDTLLYVFSTLASLPAAIDGSNYVITAKVNNSVDTYAANDSLSSDSIMSMYTPTNPIVSNQTVQFAHSAILAGTSSDSLFWYNDSMAYSLLSTDNPYTTAPLYDTTMFYVNAQRHNIDSTYEIGTSNAISNASGPSPYGAGQYGARHQFIILASELTSMGLFSGYIKDVAFDVDVVKGNVLNDFTIKIGTTQYNDLNQSMFETNLTTVSGPMPYTEFFGWNTHTFNAPFYWDGVSNIIIETVLKNTSTTPFAYVNSVSTTYKSSAQRKGYGTFDPLDNNISATFNMRPSIKITQESIGVCTSDIIPVLVEVSGIPTVDGGLTTFAEPVNSITNSTPSPVKVVLANYGTNDITAATINWSEKGVSQTPYSWTGTITNGNTDTITIDPSHAYAGGTSLLRAWINVTSDTLGINDTIESTIAVCLNGTYTIGANNADYESFSAAALDLSNNGICGPVTFNVDSGLYTESFVLESIVGSGSVNTITFQSLSNDSNDVLVIDNTTQNKNYIVRLKNMSYVTFKNMAFSATGSTYGNIFELYGHNEYITITNNNLNGTVTTSYSSRSAVLSAENVTANNITFSNNNVNNGHSTVYFKHSSYGNFSNITVENNTFNNANSRAIYLYYVDSIYINNNTINNTLPLTQYAMYLYYIRNGGSIIGNTIEQSTNTSSYGIYGRMEGPSTNRMLIANNSISIAVGPTSSGKGLYFNTPKFLDVYHNSVNLMNGSQTNVRAMEFYGGNNVKLINNILSTEHGYALYSNDANSFSQIDYNNYFVGPNDTNYVYWSTNAVADLATLKTLDAVKNAHCLSVNPEFVSNTDLHSMQISLYNSGLANTLVTEDMDGETRSTTAPSIGADEFTPPAIDLSAYYIVAPVENSCDFTNSDTITVNVKNFGMNNINFATTSATITTYISGLVQDTVVYIINSGTLNSSMDNDYDVSVNYDFSANAQYTIYSEIDIAGDANALNDVTDVATFISFPAISSFPFVEDFESGSNISFVPQTEVQSDLTVSAFAGSNSNYGLHFEGGGYSGWSSAIATVEAAFAATDHVSKAYSCNVDATLATNLTLKFDLKQTAYTSSYILKSSWFRVIIEDATGTHYLANVDGDTVFQPTTVNQDVFVNQIFNLDNYTGQVFKLSFEAALKYEFGYSSADGDNALIDNIVIWEPSAIDLGVNAIVQGENFGPTGTAADVKVAIENFGLDTLYNIPLAYQVGSNSIVRDTFYTTLEPNERDTFVFAQNFTLVDGNNHVIAFGEYVGDQIHANDTVNTLFKGMITVVPNYSDDFEGSDNWMAQGGFQQWELGTPSTININGAHSGSNAWATKLGLDYIPGSIEYLYTPYFTIPTYTDTATIEFWQFMRTVANKAYGTLEYSINDGITWSAIGYTGFPGSNNWYTSTVLGQHVWNTMDNAWKYSSIKLDPTVFNTGNNVQFRFKFTAESHGSADEGWAIDDFKVFFPSLQIDAGVSEIVLPTDSVEMGTTQTVTVKIKNFGTDTIFTTDVKYETGTTTVTENYTGMIPADSVVEFTFNQGFIVDATTFKICATTLLTGDMQIINDEICKPLVVTQASYDAGVSSIHAPFGQTTIGASTTVKVYITNYGTEPITSCDVEYTVSGNPITETFTGNILSNDSAEFVFATPYASLTGNYTVCANTQLTNDADISNDLTCVQIVGTDINSSSNELFIVLQNQPNPVINNTVIEYFLPKSGSVTYSLVNVLGETIINKESSQLKGKHQWNIDAGLLSAGVYYYTLTFNKQSFTYKMIVVK